MTATNATTTNATSTAFNATTLTATNASTSAISANTLTVAQTGTTTISSTGAINTPSLTLGTLSGFLKATAGIISSALIDLASKLTGILQVANGGTGWAALASGAIPFGNGIGAVSTTTTGTAGQVLALLNGLPTWSATSTLATLSGLLGVTNGGTDSTTQTGIVKAAGTSALQTAIPGVDYVLPSALFGYLFPGNATTTGLGINASTTIGNGAQAGGLTISGGATTTGNTYFAGNVGIGTANATQLLNIIGVTTPAIWVGTGVDTTNGAYGSYLYKNSAYGTNGSLVLSRSRTQIILASWNEQ